jgi:large subunit ribosomal protein L35
MPKIKTHKGAQKRFKVTGGGKLVRVKAWSGHHLDIKSSRRTRRYAGKAVVSKTSEVQVKRMLPYLSAK